MVLSKRRLSPWFLFALLLVIGWVSFRVVRVFLDWALVGIFLAYLTYPGYRWILARVKHAPLASLLMLILVVASIVVPGAFLISELIREVTQLTADLSATNLVAVLDALQRQINTFVGGDPDAVGNYDLVEIAVPTIRGFLTSLIADLPSQIAFAFIGTFVLLYIMYYIYIDGARLVRFVQELLPMQEAHRDLLFHETAVVVKAVMYGQILTALIQAAIAGIGYVIFGVPSVVLLSLATFVLALLPVVGPPLVWLPAAGLLIFVQGQTFAGIGLIVYSAVLVSGLDNVIRPKLIGSRARVHPVVILLGVLGGITIFGMSGLILGPLVLSIFVTLLDVYRKEFASKMDEDGGFWVRT